MGLILVHRSQIKIYNFVLLSGVLKTAFSHPPLPFINPVSSFLPKQQHWVRSEHINPCRYKLSPSLIIGYYC